MSQRVRRGAPAGRRLSERPRPSLRGLVGRTPAPDPPRDVDGWGNLLRRCHDDSCRARNGPLFAVAPLQSARHISFFHSVSHLAVWNDGGGHHPRARRRGSQEPVRHRNQRAACGLGLCDPHHVNRAITGACRTGQSGCGWCAVRRPVAVEMACSTFLRPNSRGPRRHFEPLAVCRLGWDFHHGAQPDSDRPARRRAHFVHAHRTQGASHRALVAGRRDHLHDRSP
jgi:hypothetical protein